MTHSPESHLAPVLKKLRSAMPPNALCRQVLTLIVPYSLRRCKLSKKRQSVRKKSCRELNSGNNRFATNLDKVIKSGSLHQEQGNTLRDLVGHSRRCMDHRGSSRKRTCFMKHAFIGNRDMLASRASFDPLVFLCVVPTEPHIGCFFSFAAYWCTLWA